MKIKGFELLDWEIYTCFNGYECYSRGIKHENRFFTALNSIYIQDNYSIHAVGKLFFIDKYLNKIKASSFDEAKKEVDMVLEMVSKLPAFL